MKTGKNTAPLHSQLKDELEKEILSGKYKPGELIPSENSLAAKHSISRPTVRQAIAELVSIGLIKKIKGKGTFVSYFNNKTSFDHSKGFSYTLLDCNDSEGRTIIAVYLVDGKEKRGVKTINEYFGAEFKQGFSGKFVKAEYKYTEKQIYCESYLPLTFFPEAPGQLENNALSFDILTGKFPLDPRNAKCILTIESADKKQADALGLSTGAPVIKLEFFLINGRGITVEYCINYYKTHNTEILFNKIRRV